MNNTVLIGIAAVAAWFLLKPKAPSEDLIQAWIVHIQSNPEWYAAIVAKAAANGVSVEVQLRADAIFMIEQGYQLTI